MLGAAGVAEGSMRVAVLSGYVAWSGAGAAFWVARWPWGVLGAVVAGALLARLVSGIPTAHPAGGMSGATSAWEGVAYGTAEGLLLSVLPVVVTWQLFAAVGWTEGGRAGGRRGRLGGQRSRDRGPPPRLPAVSGTRDALPAGGCSILSLAYLLTGNPLAAVGGHIVLHLAMLRRGMELPPHERSGPPGSPSGEAVQSANVPIGPSRTG